MNRHVIWMPLFLALAIASSARGADLSGEVVSPDGAPLADADVYFVDSNYRDFSVKRPTHSARTSAAGTFRLSVPDNPGPFRRDFSLWVAKPGVGLDCVHLGKSTSIKSTFTRVVIKAPTPWQAKVLDASRQPIPGAKVTFISVRLGDQSATVPDELAATLTARCDGQGVWQMPLAPAAFKSAYVKVETKTIGTQTGIVTRDNERPDVVLPAVGRLRGELVCADPAALHEVQKVPIEIAGLAFGPRVVTDDQGKFVLEHVPVGSSFCSSRRVLRWALAARDGPMTPQLLGRRARRRW